MWKTYPDLYQDRVGTLTCGAKWKIEIEDPWSNIKRNMTSKVRICKVYFFKNFYCKVVEFNWRICDLRIHTKILNYNNKYHYVSLHCLI
jgi:hypothetical protein